MKHSVLLFVAILFSTAFSLRAGAIVVSNDEWMFGNCCLATNNDTQFATDVAQFLTGGSGNILIDSNNFGLAGTDLFTLLTGLGYTVTETTTTPANLSPYAAVFVGGLAVNNPQLISYVNGGGSVFLEAGTGSISGGAAGEAAAWNTFLNTFGLGLATSYNGIGGNINVSAFQTQAPYGASLFAGVSSVFIDNGNDVLSTGTNPNAQVFNDGNGNGLYGAAEIGSTPEPSTLIPLAGVLSGLWLLARRKRV